MLSCSVCLFDQCVGLGGDLQFLVRRHHGDRHPRAGGRDQPRLVTAYRVQLVVHRQAQDPRPATAASRTGAAFSPTPAVNATASTCPVRRNRRRCTSSAGECRCRTRASPARRPRRPAARISRMSLSPHRPSSPLFLLEAIDFVDGHSADTRQMEDDGRIEVPERVPMTRPSKRRQPHRGVHADAAARPPRPTPRCPGAARSRSPRPGLAEQLRRRPGDIRVRGAVEAVAPDAVRVRGRARRSRSGPRTPASSCGRRCRRRRPAAGRGAAPAPFDAGQVRRVVQRGQRDQPLDLGEHRVVDQRSAR